MALIYDELTGYADDCREAAIGTFGTLTLFCFVPLVLAQYAIYCYFEYAQELKKIPEYELGFFETFGVLLRESMQIDIWTFILVPPILAGMIVFMLTLFIWRADLDIAKDNL